MRLSGWIVFLLGISTSEEEDTVMGGVTWLVSPTFLTLTVSLYQLFIWMPLLSHLTSPRDRTHRKILTQAVQCSFFFSFFLLSTRLFSSPVGISLFIFYLFYHREADCVLGAFYRLAFIPFFFFTLKPVSLLLVGARLLLLKALAPSGRGSPHVGGLDGWMHVKGVVSCTYREE